MKQRRVSGSWFPHPLRVMAGGASSDDEDEQEDGPDGLDALKADLLDADGSVSLVPFDVFRLG